MPKVPSIELVETKVDKDKAKKSKTEEITKMLEILSPSREATMPKKEIGLIISYNRFWCLTSITNHVD
jgi:hypothetical protein